MSSIGQPGDFVMMLAENLKRTLESAGNMELGIPAQLMS